MICHDIDDEAGKNDWVRAIIDIAGVGVGVVDRLAELELPVVPYNGGRRSTKSRSSMLERRTMDTARAVRTGRDRHRSR
jgi:hypothetical protein